MAVAPPTGGLMLDSHNVVAGGLIPAGGSLLGLVAVLVAVIPSSR